MCGTGDINVQDFKAHAVIVGGSWHFREKVGHVLRYFFFLAVTVSIVFDVVTVICRFTSNRFHK